MSVDFSSVHAGAEAGTAVAAIVTAAAILALVGFAGWGAKKVARFFGNEKGGAVDPSKDRTFSGFYSHGNGVGMYHADEAAIHKSVNRAMAKHQRQAEYDKDSDPAFNKGLFVEMARTEQKGGDMSKYTDAQVFSYRDTFDRMPDDQARAYGANR